MNAVSLARRPVYRLHTYRDAGGKWRWRMLARNGKIVADSAEGYTRRNGARAAARRLADAILQAVED